jgi:hypothetical protein
LNGNQIVSVSNVLDAGLGLLQDNGGPTRTHALLAGSVAIDTGLRDVLPVTDQRGNLRPLQSPVDIGAYEFQRSVVVILPDGGGQYTLVADLADVVVKDALNVELFRYEYTALLDITIAAIMIVDGQNGDDYISGLAAKATTQSLPENTTTPFARRFRPRFAVRWKRQRRTGRAPRQ